MCNQGFLIVDAGFQTKIDTWKERLIGFRRDNPLVRLPEGKGKSIRFIKPASEVFQEISKQDARLNINTLETDPINSLELVKKLRRKASQVFRQKGVNSLFITIGVLSWNLKGEPKTVIKSPIFLIPVELIKTSRKDEYFLQMRDEDILLNPVLAQKINGDYGIELTNTSHGKALNCETLLEQVKVNIGEFPSWEISSIAYLSIFTTPKAAMIKDLEQNVEKISQHPILRGLSGDLSAYEPKNYSIREAKHLDQRHPASVFEVVDADASQQVVIEAAKSGLSFIVQGPPGTGKSQTITNIISELIAQRKRVLIIAEKTSALDVIAKKLDSCELKDLYLPLYEQIDSNKQGFSRSIQEAIDKFDGFSSEVTSTSFFEELRGFQNDLNNHPELLHKIWDQIEKSAFDLYGELLSLDRKGIFSLNIPIRNIRDWSISHLINVREQLDSLERLEPIFREKQKTLWSKSRYDLASSEEINSLSEKLYRLDQDIDQIEQLTTQLHNSLSISKPVYRQNIQIFLNKVFHIIDRPTLLPLNWSDEKVEELKKALVNLREQDRFHVELSQLMQIKYCFSKLIQINTDEMLETARKKYKGIFRFFKKDYFKLHNLLFSYRHKKSKFSYISSLLFGYGELVHDLEKVVNFITLDNEIYGPKYKFFDPFLQTDKFDLPTIEESLDWIVELEGNGFQEEKVSDFLFSNDRSIKLVVLYDQLKNAQNSLEDGFKFLDKIFLNIGNLIVGSNQSLEQTELG